MSNKYYIVVGFLIVSVVVLLGVLIAILNLEYKYEVCSGDSCIKVSQKIKDYIGGRD